MVQNVQVLHAGLISNIEAMLKLIHQTVSNCVASFIAYIDSCCCMPITSVSLAEELSEHKNSCQCVFWGEVHVRLHVKDVTEYRSIGHV